MVKINLRSGAFPNFSWKLYQKYIKRLWNIYEYISFLLITNFPFQRWISQLKTFPCPQNENKLLHVTCLIKTAIHVFAYCSGGIKKSTLTKAILFWLHWRLVQRFCKACHIILFAVAMLVLLSPLSSQNKTLGAQATFLGAHSKKLVTLLMCQTSSARQLVHFLVDWKASNLSFIQLKGTNSSIVRGKLTFKGQSPFFCTRGFFTPLYFYSKGTQT